MTQRVGINTWVGLLVASAVSLAGCSSAPPADSGTGGTREPKVERVVFAIEPVAAETNAPRMHAGSGQAQVSPMYELPLDLDHTTGRYVPMLATEWKLDEREPSYTLTLRKGVKFHGDWGELTAQDMIHSFQQKAKEDSTGTPAVYLRQTIKEQSAPDDYTWVIKLNRPDSNFLNYLSRRIYSSIGYSRKQYAQTGDPDLSAAPAVGTGPYEFVSREPGAYVRFKRVPHDHWRVNGDFQELEVRFMKEASTRLASLIASEVHLTNLPEDLVGQAESRGFRMIRGRVPAFRLVVNWRCCQYVDPMNPGRGYKDPSSPLTDVRVRKLLSKAINREELNKALFGGKGELSINQPFHPTRQGWNPEWEKRFQEEYGYDPAKARALMAEAGFGPTNPLKLNIDLQPSRGAANAEDVMESIGNYWRAIGAQVTLVKEPDARKRDAFTDHIYMQDTNSDEWTGSFVYGSRQSAATGGMHIFEADNLLDQIAVTLDDRKRDDLYRQMGNLFFDQHKFIQLFWLTPEVAVNKDIVADYLFPGAINGNWTHMEYIKAIR